MGEISLFFSLQTANSPPHSLSWTRRKRKRGERGVLEIQRCHEAILPSPLNLSPSLIPLLLPAHSFFPVFSPGPEPERDGPAEECPRLPVLLAQTASLPRHKHPDTPAGIRSSPESDTAGSRLADSHVHTHGCRGGGKCIHRNTHTFLGRLPHTKTKCRSLVSLSCE